MHSGGDQKKYVHMVVLTLLIRSLTYLLLLLLFSDGRKWNVKGMGKFRSGRYANADEETKQAWGVYVTQMIPCLTVDYKKALKKRGDGGLLSKVATVSDEAFVFWACMVYQKRWKLGEKETDEGDDAEDEDDDVGDAEDEDNDVKDAEDEDDDVEDAVDEDEDIAEVEDADDNVAEDEAKEEQYEKRKVYKRRKREQVRNNEKDLFPKIFEIVQERRNSEWSEEWEREAQQMMQLELGKNKKRDAKEVQRDKKKFRADFPCDEIY
jgi:hypothetical protein